MSEKSVMDFRCQDIGVPRRYLKTIDEIQMKTAKTITKQAEVEYGHSLTRASNGMHVFGVTGIEDWDKFPTIFYDTIRYFTSQANK